MGVMEIAAITRSQDYTALKQNEDNKGITQQSNLIQNMYKEADTKTRQVAQSEKTDWMNKKFDAREKGNGTYGGSGGEKKKKQLKPDGVVKRKGQSGFDIKI